MDIKIKLDFKFNDVEMMIINDHNRKILFFYDGDGDFIVSIKDEDADSYIYNNIKTYLSHVKTEIKEHILYHKYQRLVRVEKLKKLTNKKQIIHYKI